MSTHMNAVSSWDVTVYVKGPFISQGTRSAGFGYDTAQAINHEKKSYIPAAQIRGLLRQAMRDLCAHGAQTGVTQKVIDLLLGVESADAEDAFAPVCGALNIADMVGPVRNPDQVSSITRIQMNDETGCVDTGFMNVIELVSPIGKVVPYTGRLSLMPHENAVEDVEKLLQRAFNLIPAVGSMKTIGFGQVEKVTIVPVAATKMSGVVPKQAVIDKRAVVELQLDRPFVLNAQRADGNTFKGDVVIPGGAIKGALARLLGRGARDDDALSKLVVHHAFPFSGDGKLSNRQPLPQSLVSFRKDDGSYDVVDWLLSDDLPVKGATVGAFQTDWKGEVFEIAAETCGYPEYFCPDYDVRVHTAIDEKTGSSGEGQLFSIAAVIPGNNVWRAEVDGQGISDVDFERLLNVLASGLHGLGKTEACATVSIRSVEEDGCLTNMIAPISGRDDLWAVTISTPALMNNPKALAQGTNVTKDYGDYWRDASDGSLQLERHYSAQSLGGGYLAQRYRLDQDKYMPFTLTDPGSVFLLKATDKAKAKELLGKWSRSNLPVNFKLGAAASDWRKCPFVPENGYGGFIVNAVDHVKLAGGQS